MNLRLLLQLAAALILTFASILALTAAARPDAPGIEVGEPFSRPSIGQAAAGVVYLTLYNRGPLPDRLVAASTPVALRSDLHMHEHVGDVARMRRIDAVAIASGETVALAPGGLHIMLSGLKAPLREGDSFALTLQFEAAGAMTVKVPVKSSTAGAGPQDAGSHAIH
jgi:periplasmic copper chaperone A